MIQRGDVVIAAIAGDYGKPRPVLIIQSDLLQELDSVVVCPITSALRNADFRIPIEPRSDNGLKKPSQVMVDKILTLPKSKLGQRVGRFDVRTMAAVELALLVVIGVA